jgi:NADPH:quinone reductase-like Zn-dependent oxidoreductase
MTESLMTAIVQDRYGSADVLELREIQRPRPRADEVIVRVHAAGVDFGVWHLMEGLPYAMRLATGLRRPRNPVRGLELAGVVEEVGAKVTAFAPGDPVFGIGEGSFAEYVRASQAKLVHMPANLGFEAAAVVPVSATTALVGLRAAKIVAGQTVLITGAGGGVGSYAVQIARAMGAEVTGVCSTSKLDFVRSLGAAHAIDYTQEDFTTGSRTYDAVIDLAGRRGVSALRRAVAPTGTVVILGGEGGGKWVGMGRQVWSQIIGLTSRQKFRSPLAFVNQADLRVLKEMLETGALTPVIDRRYPLSEVPVAIRALAAGHSRGKSVITICAPGALVCRAVVHAADDHFALPRCHADAVGVGRIVEVDAEPAVASRRA